MSSFRTIQRRNAIVPLPLLPPVPSNTIVTSVRIVHNQWASDPIEFTNPFSPSPTPTNLCFAPLSGGSAKRMRLGRRRSNCTPCSSDCDSSLLNPNRKPRSTIVVTIRLANPAPSPISAPAPRQAPAAVPQVVAAVQAKMAHKPRVSSPLAVSAVAVDVSPLSPLSSASRYTKKSVSSKKSSKGKNGRVGMLRWAVLNNSGPEVGRRIVAMGPKLAQEIWEAERIVESNEMQVMEQKQEENIEASAGCEEQRVREQLAEECIRELEEMDVDSEDIVMEQSSTLEAATTEKATETHQTENNRMDLDTAAPVAVVTPLSTARQVQIQVEIAVQVFSPAKKAQKDVEKSRRWFERIAL